MNVLDFGFGSLEAQLWQIFFLSIRCGAALMAAPMVGGMVSATVLTLVIIPSLYLIVNGWRLPKA